jgi:hypothetical protein
MNELIVALGLLIHAALFFTVTALLFEPPTPAFWLMSATGFNGYGIAF